jgi:hypothetical protein
MPFPFSTSLEKYQKPPSKCTFQVDEKRKNLSILDKTRCETSGQQQAQGDVSVALPTPEKALRSTQ